MEVLIELIIEVFGEIFIEVFANIGVELVSRFVKCIDSNSRTKKILKIVLSTLFFAACIVLLVISLIYKKNIFSILSISFILILVILDSIKFINRNIFKKNNIETVIKHIKRVVYYLIPISLIVLGSIFLVDLGAKVWLIILSSLAILIHFCIDMYRLDHYIKRRKIEKIKRKN